MPLAAILARVEDLSKDGQDRLNRWFWSGIFGELYGSASVDLRASRDVTEVLEWVENPEAQPPKTVVDATFMESRLLSIKEDSAVWKGLFALLMARGARDWRTGEPFNSDTVEELQPSFEPIFPLKYCRQVGVSEEVALSILGYTPMGKRTEVVLQGYDPARYLPRVQSKSIMEDEEFDAVLATHELDPSHLHKSQARDFFDDRRRRIVGMVEYALGKEVIRDLDEADPRGGVEGPDAFIS